MHWLRRLLEQRSDDPRRELLHRKLYRNRDHRQHIEISVTSAPMYVVRIVWAAAGGPAISLGNQFVIRRLVDLE